MCVTLSCCVYNFEEKKIIDEWPQIREKKHESETFRSGLSWWHEFVKSSGLDMRVCVYVLFTELEMLCRDYWRLEPFLSLFVSSIPIESISACIDRVIAIRDDCLIFLLKCCSMSNEKYANQFENRITCFQSAEGERIKNAVKQA